MPKNKKRADTRSSSLDGPERTRPGMGEHLAFAGEGFTAKDREAKE